MTFLGGIVEHRVFLHCLVSDSVTYFWFIMGFFLFGGENFIYVVKRTIKRVVVPVGIVALITQFFARVFAGKMTFMGCIADPTM